MQSAGQLSTCFSFVRTLGPKIPVQIFAYLISNTARKAKYSGPIYARNTDRRTPRALQCSEVFDYG